MSRIPRRGTLLAAAAALIATIAVGVSIYLEPPGTTRARALDRRRMAGLSGVQSAISDYYRRHAALPPDTGALDRDAALAMRVDWRDPVTNRVYDYEILGPAAYELCATFDHASDDRDGSAVYARAHGAGRVCFKHEEFLAASPTGALQALTPAQR